MFKRNILLTTALVVMAIPALAACAPTPTAIPPTIAPSPIPATVTSVPPTATTVPPTSTPAPRGNVPPPIIDLHFHAQEGWDIEALVRLFDQLGVAKAGSGPAGPDSLGLSFASPHPDRFIPFGGQGSLRVLIVSEGADIWNLQSPRINDYLRVLETELRSGRVKGIGEIFVNNLNTHEPGSQPTRFPADSPLMKRLLAFSATYGVAVQLHAEADGPTVAEMERLLESNRQGTLLWAHTGFTIEPPALRQLFQQHPNLICELSHRNEIPRNLRPISIGGQLRPEWKELLEEFPDRFVIGTDVGDPSLDGYAQLINYWRGILKQLSPEAAEKIAHQNAERILPRTR